MSAGAASNHNHSQNNENSLASPDSKLSVGSQRHRSRGSKSVSPVDEHHHDSSNSDLEGDEEERIDDTFK